MSVEYCVLVGVAQLTLLAAAVIDARRGSDTNGLGMLCEPKSPPRAANAEGVTATASGAHAEQRAWELVSEPGTPNSLKARHRGSELSASAPPTRCPLLERPRSKAYLGLRSLRIVLPCFLPRGSRSSRPVYPFFSGDPSRTATGARAGSLSQASSFRPRPSGGNIPQVRFLPGASTCPFATAQGAEASRSPAGVRLIQRVPACERLFLDS
jgi:hypothetical protein